MIQQKLDNSIVRSMPIAWLLIAISLSLSGCGLLRETHHVTELARRTTFLEPRFYDYINSDKIAQREARLLAEQAWGEVAMTIPNASPDYQNGFTEGFADYLYRGGEGEPPVIPPRGYWNLRFLNQFGRLTINDWYEGFRHGVQVCKSSGLRSMWLVPTSLLGGLDEEDEDSLPSSEHQLWSADPDLTMNKMVQEKEPELEPLTNPDSPPIPDPNRDLGPDTDSSDDSSDADSMSSDDVADTDLPSLPDDQDETVSSGATEDLSNPFGNDPPEDDRDPLFEPTETDPLDDALSPEPMAPDADKVEDDIFGSPEGTFDSSDSFEVEDLDFDFQGSLPSPKRTGPLAIRTVNPVAQIPSYLENGKAKFSLTSGEYDDDIPLPPGSPISSSDSAAPIPPTRSAQPRTGASVQLNPLPLSIAPPQTRAISKPPKPPTNTYQRTNQPPASTRQQIGSSLTVTDMLMDAQPIRQQPRSQQTSQPPTTMWLDDKAPPKPIVPDGPVMRKEVSWEPFEADNSLTGFRAPNGSSNIDSDEDFGALNYEDIMDERTMHRSTQWTPQREQELPLRIGGPSIVNPIKSMPTSPQPRMKLRAEEKPKAVELKMGTPSELNELPKIYVRPQSAGTVQPFVPTNTGTPPSDSIEESALRWRDRN